MTYYFNQPKTDSIYNIFEDLLGDSLFSSSDTQRRSNVISREKEIEIQLECPGLSKDDIEMSCDNGKLKVVCSPQKSVDEKYLHQEIFSSKSTNYFHLKNELDTNKIKASFNNGILSITIPRKKQCQAKRIEIT